MAHEQNIEYIRISSKDYTWGAGLILKQNNLPLITYFVIGFRFLEQDIINTGREYMKRKGRDY